MPVYKYNNLFTQNDNAVFDAVLNPGIVLAISGIYRCTSCGDEVAANKGTPLPPQNHHQHAPGAGPIRWQLVAAAVQR